MGILLEPYNKNKKKKDNKTNLQIIIPTFTKPGKLEVKDGNIQNTFPYLFQNEH
jgi:hypothetical protein